ncbi:hypothetical protein Lfu02_57550 [Longispora fulva]|uniref:DUF1453 domain-containing protein n=1 Tax=Longispora fulva TaxID=619741 RepID=A0A8J7GR49_9ACTN|nr:hypothetical protein [Longispora fulva]MBG6137264.1 hypothetical protein [Longispora fulva]GIG61383.1 hypothetical protein Lfu02_57550 [Longispora fulva]
MTTIAFWTVYGLLILALITFVIRRQVKEGPFKVRRAALLPAAMLAAGLFADHGMWQRLSTPAAIGMLAVGLLVAAATGVIRARTMTVWRTASGVITRGDRRTVVWWIASFALRITIMVAAGALGATEGFGEAMLFAGVTFGVQGLVIARRAGMLGGRPLPVLPDHDRIAA